MVSLDYLRALKEEINKEEGKGRNRDMFNNVEENTSRT